jgi:hypothetical protein
MHGLQRVGELYAHPCHPFGCQLALFGQAPRRDVLHHQPALRAVVDDVEQRDDVGMVQHGQEPGLLPEPADQLRLPLGVAWQGPLQRDDPAQLDVGGPPHDPAAARTQLFLQPVPPADHLADLHSPLRPWIQGSSPPSAMRDHLKPSAWTVAPSRRG